MSALLQLVTPRGATGAINVVDGTGVPDHFTAGLPYDSAGSLAIDTVSAIDHHHQGLPFTANSRIAASVGVAVADVGDGAAPYTAAGRLAFGTGVITHHNSGVAYLATQQIAT